MMIEKGKESVSGVWSDTWEGQENFFVIWNFPVVRLTNNLS